MFQSNHTTINLCKLLIGEIWKRLYAFTFTGHGVLFSSTPMQQPPLWTSSTPKKCSPLGASSTPVQQFPLGASSTPVQKPPLHVTLTLVQRPPFVMQINDSTIYNEMYTTINLCKLRRQGLIQKHWWQCKSTIQQFTIIQQSTCASCILLKVKRSCAVLSKGIPGLIQQHWW